MPQSRRAPAETKNKQLVTYLDSTHDGLLGIGARIFFGGGVARGQMAAGPYSFKVNFPFIVPNMDGVIK